MAKHNLPRLRGHIADLRVLRRTFLNDALDCREQDESNPEIGDGDTSDAAEQLATAFETIDVAYQAIRDMFREDKEMFAYLYKLD